MDLGGDIVCLDIEMNTARMINFLDQHMDLLFQYIKARVLLQVFLGLHDWTTECFAPKFSGGTDVVDPTVDYQRSEPTFMHFFLRYDLG